MKRRMKRIAEFQPYRKRSCVYMAATIFIVIGGMFLMIHIYSYARYNESKDIMVYQYDGVAAVVSNDTKNLSTMISYDDSYVYVDREAFENFLHQKKVEGEIYIIFGGYYKLPGLGGVAESCFYENSSQDKVVQLPYESIRDTWAYILFKLL